MDYQFFNNLKIENDSLGKIILTKEKNKILLYGKLVKNQDISNMGLEDAKKTFMKMASKQKGQKTDQITNLIGYHKEIEHEGFPIGGSYILIKDNSVILFSQSSSYGPVHPQIIKKLFQGYNLEFYDIKIEISPEEYLNQF